MDHIIDITPHENADRTAPVEILTMRDISMPLDTKESGLPIYIVSTANPDHKVIRHYNIHPHELPEGSRLLLQRDGEVIASVDTDRLKQYDPNGLNDLLSKYMTHISNCDEPKTFRTFADDLEQYIRRQKANVATPNHLDRERKERTDIASYNMGF